MSRVVQFLNTENRYPKNAGEVLGLVGLFCNSGLRRIRDHGLDLVEFLKTGFPRRAPKKPSGDRENRGRK
jgi:hypothetical protein